MAKAIVINVGKRNFYFQNGEKSETLRPNCEVELDSDVATKLKEVGGNEIKMISIVSETKKSK